MRILAAMVISFAALPAVAGPCGHVDEPTALVLNPRGIGGAHAVPGDAIVVGLAYEGSMLGGGGATGLSLTDSSGKAVDVKTVELAPSLVAYQLPDLRGSFTLGGSLASVTIADGKLPALLGAPAIRKMEASDYRVPAGSQPMTMHAVVATVKQPPEGALALVLFDAKGSARAWTRVSHDDSDFAYDFADGSGRCRGPIPGFITSKAGDRVRFAWVDAHGRLGKKSAVVTIRRGKS